MDQAKAKPKTVELRQNIYQFRSERPGCHVYLVKGQRKNILIDTGSATNFANLAACLGEVGLAPNDIHLIILTHEHFDHIGACPLFYERTVVAAHSLAANKMELQDEFVTMSKYLDEGAKHFRADIWLEADTILDLGNYRLPRPPHPGPLLRLHLPLRAGPRAAVYGGHGAGRRHSLRHPRIRQYQRLH